MQLYIGPMKNVILCSSATKIRTILFRPLVVKQTAMPQLYNIIIIITHLLIENNYQTISNALEIYFCMYPVLFCLNPPYSSSLGQCIYLVANPRQPLANSAPISGNCKRILSNRCLVNNITLNSKQQMSSTFHPYETCHY